MSGTQPFRLASGGEVDRDRPIRFRFGGKAYTGFEGDTLASALLANGVRLAGRSFKYHRPRGLIGMGVEESNVLVQLGSADRSTPNVRATEVYLYEGLEAAPVNCWPNVRLDIGGINNLMSRFLAAGFYYKTFMWPNWHFYEGIIRRAAGLGRAPTQRDPDRYESRNAHCDLLVVGSGPAGLAAARLAAASGARVMLVEQDSLLGGSLLHDDATIDGSDARAWIDATKEMLAASEDIVVLARTAAVGYFDHNALTLLEQVGNEAACAAGSVRYRLWNVRAKRVILATGALDRPLVFSGNDRPGVMLATAVRHYVRRFGVVPGKKAIVFTNNDEAYRTAFALAEAGTIVSAVVDARSHPPDDFSSRLSHFGIALIAGGAVVATKGAKALRAVQVRSGDGALRWVDCDLLAMSGGLNPTVHLFCQSGGKLRFDEATASFLPGNSAQAEESVGAAAGTFTVSGALQSGHAAAHRALLTLDLECCLDAPVCAEERLPQPLLPLWHVSGGRGKAFVDFQNDVSADDIGLAARENFISVEHLKRYTTLGMAADQGKTSNVNALAIMASLTGRSVQDTGTTRYRFPFTPMPLASFAGRARADLFRPLRMMPAHERHIRHGAAFEDYGGWMRPSCYPLPGESHAAAEQREALAVRQSAGLFEGSPLGKIEVVGPDAAKFLDLIYANTMSTLKSGKVRYGLMLNELGAIIDDGVAARVEDTHYIVCTSSGGAARIAAWLEEWLQCEWPGLDVVVAPVTTAWGVVTLTGPAARRILEKVGTSFDLAADVFPHMSFREGLVANIPARIFRVSYTGEVSYEINVPASHTPELWDRLFAAGATHGITPIGVDGWMLLRTEKGFLHIGADTDGTTTPLDVGWGYVLKKKSDFVGRRSLLLPENQRSDKLGFVGFRAVDPAVILPVGEHVVITDADSTQRSDGYVTSAGFSPVLGMGVALGMIHGGDTRLGDTVSIGVHRAQVVPPAAYDPEGKRLNG